MSWPTPKEFYDRFHDDPEKAKKTAYQIGREVGQILKQSNNIRGDNLEAVAQILNAAMTSVRSEPSAKVEGEKVVKRDRGFCIIMRSSLTLNLPWEWMDANYAWPWLEGIVSTVRSDIKMSVETARAKGEPLCTHVFEITRE
jgi:hypothetical protein